MKMCTKLFGEQITSLDLFGGNKSREEGGSCIVKTFHTRLRKLKSMQHGLEVTLN